MTESEKPGAKLVDGEQDVEGQGQAKSLTLWSGMALIVGSMIGTGVFATGGEILKKVGSPGMALVVWVVGSIVAYCGGLSYTEWGLMIPESGGDTPYLEYAYRRPPKLAAFMYCWIRVLMVHTGVCAVLALFSGQYVLTAMQVPEDHPNLELYKKLLATIVLLSVWAFTAFSNKIATRSTTIVTALKLGIVAFLIISGFAAAAGAFPSVRVPSNFTSPFKGTSLDPSAYASALFSVFFSLDGWSFLGSAIGELENPRRNVPLGVTGGVTIVSIGYILVNVAYMLVLSADEISTSKESVASKFTLALYGAKFGGQVLPVLIMLSAYGGCLAVTFAASRVAIESAKRGFLPFASRLAQLHPRFDTPFNALTFHILFSILMVVIPPGNAFFFLLEMCMYGVWVAYTVTTVGLLLVRYREPHRERIFKVWIICPIIVILTGIFLMVVPFCQAKTAVTAGAGLGVILLGVVVWYFMLYRNASKSF